MTRLVHVREDDLAPGSLVEPGRWGATIRACGPSHRAYGRELLLEGVRRAAVPAAPSRWTSAFAFESTDAAEWFAAGDSRSFLYAVTAIGEPAMCRADMTWVTLVREALEAVEVALAADRALAYWQGESCERHHRDSVPRWELVVGGPLRIVELLGVVEATPPSAGQR